MILARLEKAGLPAQLSWLPLVESWFKVRALSRASALGMWQFISSTGMRYGLDRDAWVDERLDPERATDAAIAYLVDLHDLFGDWPKALAAYNCGEARVERLSRQSSEYVDFWDLYLMLPGETRRYVPRLFAALQIIENPAKYGLVLPQADDPPSSLATVRVERSVRLDRLDAALGLEAGTLAALNPALRRQATPKRAFDLRLPAGREEALLAQIGALPEWTPPAPQYAIHRVRSGDTLSRIAARYHSSVSAIMRANNLRSAKRLRVGQRLRVPLRGTSAMAGGS
jgi:membrane-bound lytic murein transglycosylase D